MLPGDKLNAAQCRMARAALRLGIRELAVVAQVSPTSITNLERGDSLHLRTIQAIRQALEAQGIVFIEENGGGPGVRLAGSGSPG